MERDAPCFLANISFNQVGLFFKKSPKKKVVAYLKFPSRREKEQQAMRCQWPTDTTSRLVEEPKNNIQKSPTAEQQQAKTPPSRPKFFFLLFFCVGAPMTFMATRLPQTLVVPKLFDLVMEQLSVHFPSAAVKRIRLSPFRSKKQLQLNSHQFKF